MRSQKQIVRVLAFCLLLALCILGSGCASKGVVGKGKRSTNLGMPSPGKAKVVFFRSSLLGTAIIFGVHDGDKLAAILPYESFCTYECDPGYHLFSSTMGSEAVIDANLLPDRIYYVMVSAGSTFRAMHPNRPDRFWRKMPEWLLGLRETVVTPQMREHDQEGISNHMVRVQKHYKEKYILDPKREQILPEYGQLKPAVTP